MDFRMVALKAIEPHDIDGHTAEDIDPTVYVPRRDAGARAAGVRVQTQRGLIAPRTMWMGAVRGAARLTRSCSRRRTSPALMELNSSGTRALSDCEICSSSIRSSREHC